jgi:hypothetical protein
MFSVSLDPPGLGLGIQNALDVGAELLALGEHLVQFVLAEHRAQGRLGEHVGGGKIVLDLDDGPLGIAHVEVEHRVDLHRDVVAGDDVLGGNFDDLDAQIDPDHLLDERNQQDEARSLYRLEAAQGEDDGSFVLPQYLDCGDECRKHDEDGDWQGEHERYGHRSDPYIAFRNAGPSL